MLASPRLHKRFEHMNGESASGALKLISHAHYQAHPWDDLWQAVAVEHPVRDAFWDDRNLLPLLSDVDIPVYLGCEWDNVPLHLPGAFSSWDALRHDPHVRLSILGEGGLTWPWESMHIEALAWFDQHLKGRDTGILDGPPVRYWLPGAGEWRTAASWPPDCEYLSLALNPDGQLAAEESPGSRVYQCLASGLKRTPGASPLSTPDVLYWSSAPLADDLDIAGNMELRLTATSTSSDTAWIVTLQDVAPDGEAADITSGWLRASLREVNEDASTAGRPVLECRRPQAVPIGEPVQYRIPIVPNARRFAAGHQIRLMITSDDTPKNIPAIMEFRHAPVGTSSRNTIHSSSRLLLPRLTPAAS